MLNHLMHKFLLIGIVAVGMPNLAIAANIGDVVTGGVGQTELQQIDSIQNDYNLKLVFAAQNGQYLSDIQVQINNRQGQILNTITEGPILLAKFAPGQYTIVATNNGIRKTQMVTIGNRLKTYGFILPEADINKGYSLNFLTEPNGIVSS